MRREVIDGLAIGHGGDPDAPRIVLVHGAMDRGAGFLRTVRHLQDDSWTIYDRRGYGRSLPSTTEVSASFDQHVGDLIHLLEVLNDRGPSVVVGHSLGGTISLAAAARRPDLLSSLFAHEAPLPWLPWWPIADGDGRRIDDDGPETAVDRFMTRVIGRDAWERLPAATRAQRYAEGPTLVAELVSVRAAAPFIAADITVPVLIGIGSPADPIRVRASEQLAESIPDARVHSIDGAPHGAHVSHPEAFASLVRRAVELGGGGQRPTA